MNALEKHSVTDSRETIEPNADQVIFDDLYDRHKAEEFTWDEMLAQFRELVAPTVGDLAIQSA